MREILFRGKTYDGKWEQGDLRHGGYVHNDSETYIMRSDYALHNIPVIPSTVGQYTGLTDKNGKEIFEGDIVRNQYEKNRYQYFKIIYCNRTYCWLTENKYGMLGKLCNVIGDIEIIGNIHDNPELLKEGADNG